MNTDLKAFRAKRNLTQKELAEKIGVHPQLITMIETGQRRASLNFLLALDKAFPGSVTLTVS